MHLEKVAHTPELYGGLPNALTLEYIPDHHKAPV